MTPMSPLRTPKRPRLSGSFSEPNPLDDLIILKIYKASELINLQDFTEEHRIQELKMANLFNWIRLLCLLLLSVNYIFVLLFFKIQWFFFSFSNWTLFLTTFSVYVSLEASVNVEKFGKVALKKAKEQGEHAYSDKLWHHAWHHMLYTLSIISNFVMFGLYWPFLHRDAVTKLG